jgi:hypothetical protein
MECYHDSPPYPPDIMEAKLRDAFQSYARGGKGELCQELMNYSDRIREILLRMCPNILSMSIDWMTHRYGGGVGPNYLALLDYFLSIPELKSTLTEKDLRTSLFISQGTEVIQRLIDVSKEGIFDVTKSSLETAQHLIKRPHNVPTPEKKQHILMIKNALLEQKTRKRQQGQGQGQGQGVKRKKTTGGDTGAGESKGEDKGEEDEEDEESDEDEAEDAITSRERNFIRDMIKYGEDEGGIPFNNDAVGMKIYLATDQDDGTSRSRQRREYFTVTEFVKKRGGNSRLIAKKERKGKSSQEEILELDEDTVMCDWVGGTSPKQLTLWESYQEQEITEGVWSSRLTGDLQTEFNSLVDEFGKNEPVDYHPGTKDIVRDLIHPSLYPLVLSATKPKATGKKKYDETQKNFFNRPYEISRFQWLPSEVDVDQHGVARFVSPINNLDEAQYPQLYDCLGRILTHLVPGFEQVSQSLDPHPLSLAPPLP